MQREKIVEAMARGMQAECPDYFGLTWDKTPPRAQARYERYAEAALTAHDAWLGANGLAVVPVEPTEVMRLEGVMNFGDVRDIYRAMLAAAPLPAAPNQRGV